MDTNRDSSAKESGEERISPPQRQQTLSRHHEDLEGIHLLSSYSPLPTYPDDLGEIDFSPSQTLIPTSSRYDHDPEPYTTHDFDPFLMYPNAGYESHETEDNALREGRLDPASGPWTRLNDYPSPDDPWTPLIIDPSAQSTHVSPSRQPVAHHSEGDEGSDPDFRIPWDICHIGEATDPASLNPNESTPSLNLTADSVNEEYSSPDRALIRRYIGHRSLRWSYRPPRRRAQDVEVESDRGAHLAGKRTDSKRTGEVPKPSQRLGRHETSSKGEKGRPEMSPDASPTPPSQQTLDYAKWTKLGTQWLDDGDFQRANDEVADDLGFRESDAFRRVIMDSYDDEDITCSLKILADWELPQFCEAELQPVPGSDMADQISRVLTITCPGLDSDLDSKSAQALSCQDYTKLVWGRRGDDILRFILTNGVMEGEYQLHYSDLTLELSFPGSQGPGSPGQTALLEARGRPRDVADALEQFAWIASTFRPPSSQFPLSRSTVRIAGDQTNGLGYILQLDPLTAYSSSSCWTSVIPAAVVAIGFPTRKRKFNMSTRGLEIPFEIMVTLAKVSALTDVEGHQILVGPSKILFPGELLIHANDHSHASYTYDMDNTNQVAAVQWHCIESEHLGNPDTCQALRELANKAGARMKIADLVKLRCFLGYFEKATVHLGTEEPAHQEAVPLGLPKSGQGIRLAREGTLTLGFNIPGIVNGSVAGKVLLTRSLQIALGESKEYEDLLTASKHQSVVLYDVDARTGWLVSELSVVLYVCLTFLHLPETQRRLRSIGPKPPFAAAAGDGGQAALELILAYGDKQLWKKALDGEYKTFHSVVNDFLRDIRTLRNASLIHQQSSSLRVLPVLRGLEMGDIVMKKDSIDEKKLPHDMTPPWWPLCGDRKVYTIFHTGLGQVIRPAWDVPPGWETVLRGANLLVASMACVWRLNSSAQHPNQKSCPCFHITDHMAWDPMRSSCPDCKDSASFDMVQTLRHLRMNYSTCVAPRRVPRACGAIIFGDHSLFHKAVHELSIGTHRLMRHLEKN